MALYGFHSSSKYFEPWGDLYHKFIVSSISKWVGMWTLNIEAQMGSLRLSAFPSISILYVNHH